MRVENVCQYPVSSIESEGGRHGGTSACAAATRAKSVNRLKPGIVKSGKGIYRLVKRLWDAPVGFQLGSLKHRSTVGNVTVGWLAFQFTPQILRVASVVFG